MPTGTGYKFLDGGVEQDFADVFDMSSPSTTVTTGYTSAAYSGKDLGKIFTPGTGSGKITNYKNSAGQDIGSIFSLIPYVTTGTVTTTSDGTYNRILTWTTSGTIKFNKNVIVGTAPMAIITGGGAGGESGSIYSSSIPAGRGGGGGQKNTVTNMSYPALSTTYTITIGAGGKGGYYNSGSFDPINGGNSVFAYSTTYNASGGLIAQGGSGATPNKAGTAGLNNSGGGGGGGSNTSTIYSGGSGGPSGGGSGGNGGQGVTGGAGKGAIGQNGIQSGGGGGGGGGNGSLYNPPIPAYASGGDGASGSVVFKFNI